MTTDRLDALLQRFSIHAQMFHSGALCGFHNFPATEPNGQLHLIKAGSVRVQHARATPIDIIEPSLLFYPRPFEHQLLTDPVQGADLACANLSFGSSADNPIALALPAFVVLPLSELQSNIGPVLQLLFDEAFGERCGRRSVVNRLFEVVLVHILRTLLARDHVDGGLLAGLSDPQLALALNAIHADPAKPWTLSALAATACMSRSAFAASFRACVQLTPGDYLTRWRMMVAQDSLRRGRALKLIPGDTGYTSHAAFSRAFKAHTGQSPSAWRAQC
jgi:AraC-like DNA-binding protein